MKWLACCFLMLLILEEYHCDPCLDWLFGGLRRSHHRNREFGTNYNSRFRINHGRGPWTVYRHVNPWQHSPHRQNGFRPHNYYPHFTLNDATFGRSYQTPYFRPQQPAFNVNQNRPPYGTNYPINGRQYPTYFPTYVPPNPNNGSPFSTNVSPISNNGTPVSTNVPMNSNYGTPVSTKFPSNSNNGTLVSTILPSNSNNGTPVSTNVPLNSNNPNGSPSGIPNEPNNNNEPQNMKPQQTQLFVTPEGIRPYPAVSSV